MIGYIRKLHPFIDHRPRKSKASLADTVDTI